MVDIFRRETLTVWEYVIGIIYVHRVVWNSW